MSPGLDPALGARFRGWLQGREPGMPLDERLLARLGELGGFDSGADDLPALPHESPERPGLLRLQGLWREFASSLPADWVELAGDRAPTPRSGPGVAWIEPRADEARVRPPGPVPALVSSASPPPPRKRPFPLVTLSILGVALFALGGPAFYSLRAARVHAIEMADLEEHLAYKPPPLAVLELRVGWQAHLSSLLIAARTAQREAVNRTCEGEPDCLAHLASLDRSLHLARLVAAAAEEDAAHEAVTPRSPGGKVPRTLLADERSRLQQQATDVTSPAAARVMAQAELAALEAVLGAAVLP